MLIVSAMGVLLGAPLIQMAYHFIPHPELLEYRPLQPFPGNIASRFGAFDPTLPIAANGWFDDHYGLRDILILTKNEIDYQLFRTSRYEIIGREGWVFERENYDLVNKNNAAADVLLPKILKKIADLAACLQQKNVRLVLVVDPNKTTIYPQYLPYYTPPPMQQGLMRRVADALRQRKDMIYIDAEKILQEHPSTDLYYRMDVHWNPIGSSLVFYNMLEHIAAASGRPVPKLQTVNFFKSYMTMGSGSRFLGKWITVGDDGAVAVSNSAQPLQEDESGHWMQNIGDGALPINTSWPVFDWVFEHTPPIDDLLPPILLYGTSFSMALVELRYHDAFSRIYYTRGNEPMRIGPALVNMPSEVKFFVLEYPEYYLHRMLEFPIEAACTPSLATSNATSALAH